MGASLPFSRQSDFYGITSTEHIRIDQIIHKSFIEINEKGVEAAAATAIIAYSDGVYEPKIINEFICNRPFMFFIHDKMFENIYFVGKYAQPK